MDFFKISPSYSNSLYSPEIIRFSSHSVNNLISSLFVIEGRQIITMKWVLHNEY